MQYRDLFYASARAACDPAYLKIFFEDLGECKNEDGIYTLLIAPKNTPGEWKARCTFLSESSISDGADSLNTKENDKLFYSDFLEMKSERRKDKEIIFGFIDESDDSFILSLLVYSWEEAEIDKYSAGQIAGIPKEGGGFKGFIGLNPTRFYPEKDRFPQALEVVK